jgi:hypothetical protein
MGFVRKEACPYGDTIADNETDSFVLGVIVIAAYRRQNPGALAMRRSSLSPRQNAPGGMGGC